MGDEGPRIGACPLSGQRRRGKLAAMSASSSAQVSDHRAQSRFEINTEGATAFLLYERTDTSLTLIHTEVPPALRGRHLGEALVDFAVADAQASGLRLIVICPFARAYLRKKNAGSV